jgi:hypothetical protein
LTKLRELWLGRNRIERIGGVSQLTALQRLSLQSNRLAAGDGLQVLSSLKELYLNHNGLTSMAVLAALTNLQVRQQRHRPLEQVLLWHAAHVHPVSAECKHHHQPCVFGWDSKAMVPLRCK